MQQNIPPLAKENVNVLLIANHRMVQEGFKLLIESNRELVVAATRSLDDKIEISDFAAAPDVAVVYLTQYDRVEVISDLLRVIPDLRIIVTVAGENLDLQATALELGAVGIVHEEQSPSLLIEAIKQTYAGETWLNQVLLDRIMKRSKSGRKSDYRGFGKFDAVSGTEQLTKRELEVLKLIGNGLKNKQIALSLLISEPTVRCHLSSIYGKVGVNDRLNLVIKAYQLGLLHFPQSSGTLEPVLAK